VTFFKLGIDKISAQYNVGDHGISLDLPRGVNLDTSSLATRACSSSIGLIVPLLNVSLLCRNETNSRRWEAVGSVATDLSLDLYNAPVGWEEKASLQQEFLKEMDEDSRRIWYMYTEGDEFKGEYVAGTWLIFRPQSIFEWCIFTSTSSSGAIFIGRR
jgi:hypothetical protein